MLLTGVQAAMLIKEVEKDASNRTRRSAQTGPLSVLNKWTPGQPIGYFFDSSIDEETRELIRHSVKYWEENTCLSFQENAFTRPRVRFFKGQGCFSQVGKDWKDAVQSISIGNGCEMFGTTTHEIAHTLGLFHEQSRTDRDSYISLIQANVGKGWASQYAKEPASHQTSLNVPYDYGSVMHYSAYDPNTELVIILAKKKPYQHSMGNNYGPIFNDLLLMNKYYKCSDKCTGATCKNNGFPHPRDCSKCICPNGFGGDDCSERQPGENGAPPECGETVLAKAEFQELSGSVDSGPGNGKFKITEKQAGCHFHIKAPPGLHVEVRVKSLSGACTPECYFGSTEIKYEDFTSGGVRMCCPSHISDVGAVVSSGELAIASVYSQKGTQSFTLEYRATAAVSSGPGGKCQDSSDTCEKSKFICDHETYRNIMANQCKRTCGYCTSPPNTEPPISSSSSGGGGTPAATCKDDNRCKSWLKSGFCKQSFYTDAMKKQYCPKSCGFC